MSVISRNVEDHPHPVPIFRTGTGKVLLNTERKKLLRGKENPGRGSGDGDVYIDVYRNIDNGYQYLKFQPLKRKTNSDSFLWENLLPGGYAGLTPSPARGAAPAGSRELFLTMHRKAEKSIPIKSS